MRQEQPDRSAASIIEFCHFARTNGLPAGVQQTLCAIEASETMGDVDRRGFAFALRTVLSSSKEEWDLFDALFEAFWRAWPVKSGHATGEAKEARVRIHEPKTSSRALSNES